MTGVLIAGGGTGGHLMPALALAEALARERADVEPVLVGARRGVEATLLPSRTIRHYLIPAEPVYRRHWWKNVRWPLVAWRLAFACRRIIRDERPALAVGTGGYAAGPILFAAHRAGIPIALQEQNALPGVTTRWLAPRARQIHLGFPEARVHLRPGPHTAVFTYGNPIVPPPDPRPDAAGARARLGVPDKPVLFVMGGSQGARAINEVVAQALDTDALGDVTLLWSTGALTWERFRHYHAPPRRQVRPFWDPVAEAYAAANVVIARAGAMSTAELCAWGLPAVLVPLPTAAADHQARNAQALASAGAAIHLPEAALSVETLTGQIGSLLADPTRREAMRREALARGHPDAAQQIARTLLGLVS